MDGWRAVECVHLFSRLHNLITTYSYDDACIIRRLTNWILYVVSVCALVLCAELPIWCSGLYCIATKITIVQVIDDYACRRSRALHLQLHSDMRVCVCAYICTPSIFINSMESSVNGGAERWWMRWRNKWWCLPIFTLMSSNLKIAFCDCKNVRNKKQTITNAQRAGWLNRHLWICIYENACFNQRFCTEAVFAFSLQF